MDIKLSAMVIQVKLHISEGLTTWKVEDKRTKMINYINIIWSATLIERGGILFHVGR